MYWEQYKSLLSWEQYKSLEYWEQRSDLWVDQCAFAEAIIRSWRCRSLSCCLSIDTVLFSVAASLPPVFTEGEAIFFIALCAA